MAFDGVTIANVVSEMRKELLGGRLYKIAQPSVAEFSYQDWSAYDKEYDRFRQMRDCREQQKVHGGNEVGEPQVFGRKHQDAQETEFFRDSNPVGIKKIPG